VGKRLRDHRTHKGRSITVNHETTETEGKDFNAEVKPEIEVSENVKVSIGSVGVKAEGSREAKLEFSDLEYPLTAAVRHDSILWQQSMTQDHKAIRDFIFGMFSCLQNASGQSLIGRGLLNSNVARVFQWQG